MYRPLTRAKPHHVLQEGIGWESVQFLDNVECLSTIEGKQGILSLLDEVCILPQVRCSPPPSKASSPPALTHSQLWCN